MKKDPRLERAGVEVFNKPKRTPSHPTKSHVVVAKEGDKIKTIRFGQQGVSGLQETKVELVKREATKNAKGHLSHLVDAFKQKLNAHTVGRLAEMQCVDGILKIARRNHDPD